MSQRFTHQFYYAQGKDFGIGGLPIPSYWLPPFNSWQARAFRDGHAAGVQFRNISTPLSKTPT